MCWLYVITIGNANIIMLKYVTKKLIKIHIYYSIY